MRRWAFALALAGIFILFVILDAGEKSVLTDEELQTFEVNSLVSVSGFVESVRVISGERKLISLENGIVLICECDADFSEGNFTFSGIVSEFEGKKEIEVLKAINVG